MAPPNKREDSQGDGGAYIKEADDGDAAIVAQTQGVVIGLSKDGRCEMIGLFVRCRYREMLCINLSEQTWSI